MSREYQAGENYSTIIQFAVEWGRIRTDGQEELAGCRRYGVYGYVANQAFLDFGGNISGDDYYRNWVNQGGVTKDKGWYFDASFSPTYEPTPDGNANEFRFPIAWSTDTLTVHKFVRVTKTTPETYSTLIKRVMALVKVTEYSPIFQTYPLCSVVHTMMDAKAFSNIPERSFVCRLKTVFVPNNYYPMRNASIKRGGQTVTRETDARRYNIAESLPPVTNIDRQIYRGNWDFISLKKEWTDNPVWIVMDILTSKRYGLGAYVTMEDIDMISFYNVARYCDGVDENGIFMGFPDGNGGLEPRYSFSAMLRERMRTLDCITNILAMIDGYFYWDNGKICLGHKKETRKIRAIFNNRTVKEGIFNYSTTQRDERYNVIEVGYLNRHDMFRNAQEFCINEEDLKDNGVIKNSLNVWGCTSKGLAKRLGDKALAQTKEVVSTVSFQCGLEALFLQLNDIFLVDDDLITLNENYARLLGVRDVNPEDPKGNLEFVIDRVMDYNFTVVDGRMTITLYKKSARASFEQGKEVPNNTLTLSSPTYWIEDNKNTVISIPKDQIGEYDPDVKKSRMKTFSQTNGDIYLGNDCWYATFDLKSLVGGQNIGKITKIETYCTMFSSPEGQHQWYDHRVSPQLNVKTSQGWSSYYCNEADSKGDYQYHGLGPDIIPPPQKVTFSINKDVGGDICNLGFLMMRPYDMKNLGGTGLAMDYFKVFVEINGVEVEHHVGLRVTSTDNQAVVISEDTTKGNFKTVYNTVVSEYNTRLPFITRFEAGGRFLPERNVGRAFSISGLMIDGINFSASLFEDETTQIHVPVKLYNMDFGTLTPSLGEEYVCIKLRGTNEVIAISQIVDNKSCNFGGTKIVPGYQYELRPFSYLTGPGQFLNASFLFKTDSWQPYVDGEAAWSQRVFDNKYVLPYIQAVADVWGQRYSDYEGGFTAAMYGFYPGSSVSVKTRNNLTRMYRLSNIKDSNDNTFEIVGNYLSQESYEALAAEDLSHMKAVARDHNIPLLTNSISLMAVGDTNDNVSEEEYDRMMGILLAPNITSINSVFSGSQATVTVKWQAVDMAAGYKIIAKNVYNQEVGTVIAGAGATQAQLILPEGTYSIFVWTINTDDLLSRYPSSGSVYVYDPQTASKSPKIVNIEVTSR